MCGIVGQVKPVSGSVEDALLARMCAALEHRGPDARGLFVDGNAGLGIQRLRVIDLATGDQPIQNEDKSIAVVLNGEIYNYRELREQLIRRGHVLATQGDTEVIVHLYEEYGADCVQHLHGMFAFALWDRRRRRLLLARDRIGKKPLFYALRGRTLTFASELRALLQDRTISREVDLAAIDCYLAYGYIPTPRSVFTSIRKLPPAHTLVLDSDGRVELKRYWRLDYSRKLTVEDPRELHEPIRDAIRTATRRRLVADVPLGAFLSGGIDSSAVVAAMARESAGAVKTFSIGFENRAFDELPHARRVAELLGTDHHEFVVRPDAIEVVPRIVRQYGEPFADTSAIPSFHLAEVTRAQVTVALNGDGGDESFGGYTRYIANRLAHRLDVLPATVRRAAGRVGERLHSGQVTSLTSKARRLATGLALSPADRYARYQAWFETPQRDALYTDEFRAATLNSGAAEVIAGPWAQASGDDVVDVMLEVDALTYLPDDLITKIDIATMAHALEARSPLLDHELMEFAASVPADLKVRGRQKKWILRQALRPWLPDDILDRPKQGFMVPVADWFRGELREQVHDVLLDPAALGRGYFRADSVTSMLERHCAGTADESKRLWALYVLELWHRDFVDAGAASPELAQAAA
jgi:asparagine synthase (glutamine-hydrolysing)